MYINTNVSQIRLQTRRRGLATVLNHYETALYNCDRRLTSKSLKETKVLDFKSKYKYLYQEACDYSAKLIIKDFQINFLIYTWRLATKHPHHHVPCDKRWRSWFAVWHDNQSLGSNLFFWRYNSTQTGHPNKIKTLSLSFAPFPFKFASFYQLNINTYNRRFATALYTID